MTATAADSSPSELQQELRKRLPFDTFEEEVFLNMWRTFDLLQNDTCKLLDEHGLTSQRYNVLRILRGHGKPGLPAGEIAAQMVTRMPDITRLIDRLETDGLVKRTRSEQDRRCVRITSTPKAAKVLAKLDEPLRTIHEQQMNRLSRTELEQLNAMLVNLRKSNTPSSDAAE
ncbi:MarR family winged helix-turn-helix transcriptional regulator [Aeoliella mucimassa]|uniref:Transcriptional activatory protein BadR n=1 Tax=Aeoliella mucimassa TaxID=2527972 RepID=A0A518AKL8_9BACT|nr:MarR family transcriptional regulator [Aeoliella mucimassa]QDU55275.1 Transcriptional activatory protein BadR [Aeoliella mucimassa]